jgi:hypothetical protein
MGLLGYGILEGSCWSRMYFKTEFWSRDFSRLSVVIVNPGANVFIIL